MTSDCFTHPAKGCGSCKRCRDYRRDQRTVRHVPPTAEAFHLAHARSLYVCGRLTIEGFELAAAHVVAGGVLDRNGRPSANTTLNDALHTVTNVLTANEIREIRSR